MAQLVVRNLDEDVKERLKQRASRFGRSMEEEARDILRNAVLSEDEGDAALGSKLAKRFAGLGLDRDLPELKGEPVKPARFDR